MENISQEVKKVEEYSKLYDFDVGTFILKMMGVVVLCSLFVKHIVNPVLGFQNNDIFALTIAISLFGFGWYEINKINQSKRKQEEFKFEIVNVYDFLSKCVNASPKLNPIGIDVIYKIVAAKALEQCLKTSDAEGIQSMYQEIESKTLEMSSLEAIQTLQEIRVKST